MLSYWSLWTLTPLPLPSPPASHEREREGAGKAWEVGGAMSEEASVEERNNVL